MRKLIFLEEITKLGLCWLAAVYAGCRWWAFGLLLFVPDLSLLGYLVSNKAGAWLYNLFHHQTTALLLGLAGLGWDHQVLQLAGLLLLGHSALDRALGLGLKYETSFYHTHLGPIGKKAGS